MDTTVEDNHELSLGLAERREELTELLRTRLIECGWRDQVAGLCRKIIEEQGVEQVRLADILGGVKAEARNTVPQGVRNELLGQIRKMRQELEREAKSSD